MEIFLEMLSNNLKEVSIFMAVFLFLIGIKLILSAFKMPPAYKKQKKAEKDALKKILLSRQINDFQKSKQLKDMYDV